MHIERRRMIRRAFSGGVLFALVGLLPLWLMEALYVLLVRGHALESAAGTLEFLLHSLLVLVLIGAVLGAVEGPLILGVSLLTSVLARRRMAEAKWMSWICSFLSLPAIAMIAAKIFSGRRASQIPGKDFIALAIGVLGLAAAYGMFRLIIGCRDRFRIRRWGPRQAALLGSAMLLLAVIFYVADQMVLVRLYAWFHVGLAAGAVACCQLALGALYSAYRPRWRWMGRLAEPGIALLVLVAAIASGLWSLDRIGRSQSLRFLFHQHTAVQSKVLSMASHLGLASRGAPPLRPQKVVKPKEAPLPPLIAGPRRANSSILLITVDALRADHLGTYGYQRKTTPSIDRWAQQAAVFSRAYCQAPHTSFSMASLMTGAYLYSANKAFPHLRHRTMAQVLRRYGFKTAAFFPPAVFYIDRQSFSAFEKSKFGFEHVKYEYLDAARRVDQVLDFLRQHKKRRVLVWAHFFEPHEPYEERAGFGFGPRAIDRYDSEIAYVDHHVGRLLDHVRKELPDTIIALTADHGEEFGEHGAHYHGNALYDQQVRVPLIISVPGLKGQRIAGPVQVIDLPSTLLSVVDIPIPASMQGTDLGPWLAGEPPARLPPVFSELEQKKMVVQGAHKLICDVTHHFCELYDLQKDPAEQHNLAGRLPAKVDQLRAQLTNWISSRMHKTEDDEADVAHLLQRGLQRDPGVVQGLIKLCTGSAEVRRRAVGVLTHMRAPAALQHLIKASEDRDPGVALPARVGAALLGHRQSLGRLPVLLERPDLPPALRRDALLALARAGHCSATLPLAQLLSSTSQVYQQQEIIEVLGELGDPAAAPALREKLSPLRTRLYAIEALGKVRAKAAVPDLIHSLRTDRFISWRSAAARALGLIKDKRAVDVLQKAVRQELETAVVTEALRALARLESLPRARVRPLKWGGWSCAANTCQLDLGVSCADTGKGDLLLVFDPPNKDKAQPPAEVSVDKPRQGGSLAVRCGSSGIHTLNPARTPTAMIHLPPLQTRLNLHTANPPPSLVYAALRPGPRSDRRNSRTKK